LDAERVPTRAHAVGDLHEVSSMFTMEQIKSTTELPLVNASTRSGRHEAQTAQHSLLRS
jgi:Lrp/AsnC family transcriptional regulator